MASPSTARKYSPARKISLDSVMGDRVTAGRGRGNGYEPRSREPPKPGRCICLRRGSSSPSAERGRLLDERALILRAREGDPEAFAALVRQHEELAFRAAYLIVREASEAEDVTQEAFLRAHRALGRFDPEQAFRPWLLRIVTNQAINSVRSSRRRGAMRERFAAELRHRGDARSPEVAAEAAEEARRVWDAVGALPPHEQALVYLRYFLDASEQEAAAAIGRPVSTVKSRMHRALRRLRGVIEERYPDLAPRAAGDLSRGRS